MSIKDIPYRAVYSLLFPFLVLFAFNEKSGKLKTHNPNDSLLAAIRPIPYMYVDETVGGELENNFLTQRYPNATSKTKSEIFNSVFASQKNYYDYPIKFFHDDLGALIKNHTGIRIYFGAYDSLNSLPKDLQSALTDKQFVVIFAPTDFIGTSDQREDAQYYQDAGTYWIISLADMKLHEISETSAEKWTKYFVLKYMKAPYDLTATLDYYDPNNSWQGNAVSDTRSIHYRKDYFVDFFNSEVDYQKNSSSTHPHTADIDMIRIQLACFDSTGIGINKLGIPDLTSFKNRMLLMFEYLVKGKQFYLETTDDFQQRAEQSLAKFKAKHHDLFFNKNDQDIFKALWSGDNGQLCPPNCPPPSPPSPPHP